MRGRTRRPPPRRPSGKPAPPRPGAAPPAECAGPRPRRAARQSVSHVGVRLRLPHLEGGLPLRGEDGGAHPGLQPPLLAGQHRPPRSAGQGEGRRGAARRSPGGGGPGSAAPHGGGGAGLGLPARPPPPPLLLTARRWGAGRAPAPRPKRTGFPPAPACGRAPSGCRGRFPRCGGWGGTDGGRDDDDPGENAGGGPNAAGVRRLAVSRPPPGCWGLLRSMSQEQLMLSGASPSSRLLPSTEVEYIHFDLV